MESNGKLLVKGAFHVHSTFSGDGEVPLTDIKQMFMQDGFNVVAICEHQHDMDTTKFRGLIEECDRLSDTGFLMIPGIEFNCYRNQILGIGIDDYRPSVAADEVVPWIKDHGGFAVWAHPKKNEYCLPEHVVDELDGIEIWNSKFDGKYAPREEVVRYYRTRQANRPQLRAICSIDYHFRAQFRHLPMYCEVSSLTADQVVESLRAGRYFSKTAAFRLSSEGAMAVQAHALRRLLNTANMWVFDQCKHLYRKMKRRRIALPAAMKNVGRRLFS